MTTFIFANNIETSLAGGISSASTSITLSSTLNLPTSIPTGSYLVLTLNDQTTRTIFEIVYVTAISGATATVLRAQEGTSAKAWLTGDFVFSGPTAGQMQNFFQTSPSGVTPGSYGSSTQVGQFTVNSVGQITAASNVAIAFPITSFNGRAGAIVLNSGDVTSALGYNPVNKAGDTMTGALTINSTLSVTTTNSGGTITITDTGANGANLKFVGNGSTTPNKFIRANAGNLDFVNSAYSAVIASLNDAGTFTANAFTTSGIVTSGSIFSSTGTTAVLSANGLSTTGTGAISVRPNGANNATGISTFTSAGGLTLAGGLNATTGSFSGQVGAGSLGPITGTSTVTVQGGAMGWNMGISGFSGEVDFLNNHGLGGGGWIWSDYNSTGGSQHTSMTLTAAGALTTSAGATINGNLQVNGTLSNTGTASLNTTSDEDLKSGIDRTAKPQPLHRGAPWASYYWLEDGTFGESPIAQDVLKTKPRYVVQQEKLTPSGRKALGITPINMALEQSWWCGGRIDEQQSQIDGLCVRVAVLEARP